MANITSDVSRMSVIFTEFTYFPRDASETHTSLHSTELQLIFALWVFAKCGTFGRIEMAVHLCDINEICNKSEKYITIS